MPAEFNQGFFVRVPAWHGLGIVLDDYPGREEAQRLAGHDFDVVSAPAFSRVGIPENPQYVVIPGWKQLIAKSNGSERSAVHGNLLNLARDSYEPIQNSVPYDFAEALLEQGFQYETGITLKDGALCAITLKLDEPITITGDDSPVLPYLGLSWSHDGSGALRGRSTTVRQVCANTVAASEAEGARLGTDFSIRHTKNWRDRVADAKKAIQGTRKDIESYREAMEAFAAMPITRTDVRTFAEALVLDQTVNSIARYKADVASGKYSVRVQNNVEREAAKVMALFNGPTIPEAHKLTGYGLFQAGVEYLDHVRKYQSTDSYVGRTLLRNEPAKARLPKLVRELAEAAA
jgi:phage/plasmid-like protein (TIGR03299 family)